MFTSPEKNLRFFDLRETDVVVDIGAGTGFYSVAAGHMVKSGKVYAVELHKDLIETIRRKAKDAHLSNIETVWGNAEKLGGTKIGDDVANAVIASNVLHQVEDHNTFVLEIKRILRSGGKVLIIDWSDASEIAPKTLFVKSKAKELFEKHGFTLERDVDAGAHHYGMIMVNR